MDKLTDFQQKTIQILQKKVDKYQVIPMLCDALTPEQCIILAELQVIYDNLSTQTLTNHSAIFNTVCKAVKDKMNQFSTIYSKMPSEQLYCIYLKKYKEAKMNTNEKYRLDKLLDSIPLDNCNEISNTNEIVSR
ncbi:hypothetical protein I4U23_001622 [Adineta vaga]|nr:hypothetical protein I4U23_001622 [Adineta vaga]